jgi:hypothetical protein
MKIVLQRKGESLVPVDEQGFDLLHKIRDGREVMAEVKRARNPQHHRLFFAILKFMIEHTEFETPEIVKTALMIATGNVEAKTLVVARSGGGFWFGRTTGELIDDFKDFLKVKLGYAEPFIEPASERTYWVLRSINWASMDQERFAEFFDRAIDVIVTRWMPAGTSAEAVRAEIIKMADGPMRAGIEDQRR